MAASRCASTFLCGVGCHVHECVSLKMCATEYLTIALWTKSDSSHVKSTDVFLIEARLVFFKWKFVFALEMTEINSKKRGSSLIPF